ncbi:efflux RND transporter periplasmic adaptor subunit [Marinobacterium sp. D7]|uniref:efflux RND transporter periplasmic adaptor subunit n=1 Tax=Marinobacterium ramblicola TaxID=2849041 RepID=UPI001C2CEEC3|nr:efflux RND transporter periplasmic adaptor subunit [Marinobacterium ramblicola]MBV1786434.1 efflux RND transporter periplasmic adaptor subunit [Marinobacterium ramblicola]
MRYSLKAGLLVALLVGALPANAEYEARAVIKALDRAVLSGELAARVERLPFLPGDAFKKGDVLVALDCTLYEAQAEKVSAEVRAAKIKRDNTQELKVLNSIGELDVALAQSEYSQSLAELKIARLNTQRCVIKAPWNGRVVSLRINAQENIRQQQELIEIVGDRNLEVEVVVPASWLNWLAVGQSISLQVDDRTEPASAEVSAIIPAIDAVSQTVLLRAKLPQDTQLIPGMSATAVFNAPVQ